MKNKPRCEYIRLDKTETGQTLQLQISEHRRKYEVSATLTKTIDADKWHWMFYDGYSVEKVCFTEQKNTIPHFDFILHAEYPHGYLVVAEAMELLEISKEGWVVVETNSVTEKHITITMKGDSSLKTADFSLNHGKNKRFHPYTADALDAKIAKLMKPKSQRRKKSEPEPKGIEVTTADIMTGIGTMIMSSFIRKNGISQDVLDKVKAGNCVKLDGTIVDNPFKPFDEEKTVGPQDTMGDKL